MTDFSEMGRSEQNPLSRVSSLFAPIAAVSVFRVSISTLGDPYSLSLGSSTVVRESPKALSLFEKASDILITGARYIPVDERWEVLEIKTGQYRETEGKKGRQTFPYLPKDYDHSTAVWNHSFREKYFKYQKKMVTISFLIPLALSLFFILSDLMRGKPALLPKYIIPLAGLSVLLVVFLLTMKTDFFSTLITLIGLAGGLLSLIIPGTRDSYLLIIFFFPTLAFQLQGTRRGGLWILSGLIVFSILVVLYNLGRLPFWSIQLSPSQSFFLILAWVSIVVTQYYTSIQNDHHAHTLQVRLIYDSITGFPNKEVLYDTIHPGRDYLFIIISVENYQDLRNLFGYDMSDKILLHIRTMIDQLIHRMEIYPFKLKGSEFGLLVPRNIDAKTNEEFLDEIYTYLCSQELSWNETNIHIYLRLGAAEIDPQDVRSFLSNADLALEKARQSFRQIHIFHERDEIHQESFGKVRDFSLLQQNLQESLLQVYYQPIVDAKTRKMVWHEALLRIQDGAGNVLLPSPFIEIAEQLGMGTVVSKALLKILSMDVIKSPDSLSLNMTHRDLLDPEFLYLAESFLEAAEGKYQVIFEILESQNISNNQACMNFIESIHRKKGMIALDDFGSGYSNLVNLFKIPFDILKIDGELIRQIEKNPESVDLIAGVAAFCRTRGLKTAAEYVETSKTADLLTEMGVDYLQGYLFGKPKPLGDLG